MSKQDPYTKITEALIETMENGNIPWAMPWDNSRKFESASNFTTGKQYNGFNQMILTCAWINRGHARNIWATFNQIKQLGGYVRKGETSTAIAFWAFIDKTETKDDGTEKTKKIPMLRYFNVFNLDQCEGIDIEQIDTDSIDSIDNCDELAYGFDGPDIVNRGVQAYYSPAKDVVVMPERQRFDDSDEYYSVLFHELVHSTGHADRLDRIDKKAAFGEDEYGKEELVAEIGSAFLCSQCGIEMHIENKAAYLRGWLKRIKGDRKLVVHAASAAQKAIDWINTNRKG